MLAREPIRSAATDARRAMHPHRAALLQDVHAKLSGARGRGTNPKIGKNATPQKEGQLPAHTAIMLLRTMKLLFSFEQVKHCDFAVFY